MTENLQPAASSAASARIPRTLTVDEMLGHIDSGRAVALKPGRRDMFLHYDGTWWIGDTVGFTEITEAEQNARLDRWRQRLNDGALWT